MNFFELCIQQNPTTVEAIEFILTMSFVLTFLIFIFNKWVMSRPLDKNPITDARIRHFIETGECVSEEEWLKRQEHPTFNMDDENDLLLK